MSDMLMQYGLFLAQSITIVAAIGAAIALVAVASRRAGPDERLEIRRLNERLEALARRLREEILPRKQFKSEERRARKARKRLARDEDRGSRRRVFVLDFRGDLRASGVARLREEVSAVLTIARDSDEVVVRLENSGGLVHDHGLAASQLLRIRAAGVPLTVTVDKVAASGGYMMACTAERIIAAPFAILGSIGVLLQLPNFHRALETHGVDFEQVMGGDHKRTLTLFAENTDADRDKARQDVEDIHGLFKAFVTEHRPSLDLAAVATGEHWYGTRALDLGLCDRLGTSDDYLVDACSSADVYLLEYKKKQPLARRLAVTFHAALSSMVERLWQREGGLAGG